MEKNTILLCNDDYEPIEWLSIDQKGRLLDAIFKYSIYGNEDVDEDIKVAFLFLRQRIDRHNNAYEKTCERNRKNGKGGGNPKFKKGRPNPYYNEDSEDNPALAKITEDNRTLAKITLKDKDKDRDMDMDKDMDRMFSNENDNNFPDGKCIEKPSPIGDEKKSPQKKGFVKPSVGEVRDYCDSKGYGFDPEAFIAFYESNGWRVSRNPMRDWKMACVTWQKKFEEDRRREGERRSRYGNTPSPAPKERLKSPIPEYTDEEWNRLTLWQQDEAVHKHYGI